MEWWVENTFNTVMMHITWKQADVEPSFFTARAIIPRISNKLQRYFSENVSRNVKADEWKRVP